MPTKQGVVFGLTQRALCFLERKKSKRKNSPWIRPDVDMQAGKQATWRLR